MSKKYFSLTFPELEDPRPLPLILQAWFFLLALWALSNTAFTQDLRGLRLGHQFYYLEFLFPFALYALFCKPRHVKLPKAVLAWGVWLVVMAAVGYLKGHFPSLIYDRSRNWGAMVLLLLLLHRFQVSPSQLMRLLKPVFIAAVIGYPLAVLFPAITEDIVVVRDLLGFNFMAAAYAIAVYLLYQFQWWHIVALSSALSVPVYLGARAKFLAMLISMLTPAVMLLRRCSARSLSMMIPVVLSALLVVVLVKPSEQSTAKSIRSGGLKGESLKETAGSRLLEHSALVFGMTGLDYAVGKGSGATWSGGELYDESSGTDRQNFHIYYLEIIYWYGFLGLALWFAVGVLPVVSKVFFFATLSTVGIMGFCSQVALLLSWFGHAGYSMCEGSFIGISLYALHCGTRSTPRTKER